MKLTDAHRSALCDVLTWRRDVRHFRTDPIDEVTLDKLRQQMALAPSVGNARPWRVVQVSRPDLRAQIIESFTACNNAAAQVYPAEERSSYLALKLAGLLEAPVHLAVFTETSVTEGRGLGRQTMPETLSYSTVMAIHTLWLAARAHNIGVGWVSILDPEDIVQILDTPPTWAFTGYLCLGYAARDSQTPLLHDVGWQENTSLVWQEK